MIIPESVGRSADFSDDLKPLNWARADMHHYLILSSLPWTPLISICPSPVCLCSFMPFFKVDCKAFGTKISGVLVNGKDRLTASSCPDLTVGNGGMLQCWQQEWVNLPLEYWNLPVATLWMLVCLSSLSGLLGGQGSSCLGHPCSIQEPAWSAL